MGIGLAPGDEGLASKLPGLKFKFSIFNHLLPSKLSKVRRQNPQKFAKVKSIAHEYQTLNGSLSSEDLSQHSVVPACKEVGAAAAAVDS